MKKYLWPGLVVIYILFAIFITICLLSCDDYGIFKTRKYEYLILSSAVDDYPRGTLLKFSKCNDLTVLKDKYVYYFNVDNKLVKEMVNEVKLDGEQYVLAIGGNLYKADRIVGEKIANANPTGGKILKFLTNKYVYLLIFIMPTLALLIYEIYLLVKYVKSKVKKVTMAKEKTLVKN